MGELLDFNNRKRKEIDDRLTALVKEGWALRNEHRTIRVTLRTLVKILKARRKS
jgi:hypothetical protein